MICRVMRDGCGERKLSCLNRCYCIVDQSLRRFIGHNPFRVVAESSVIDSAAMSAACGENTELARTQRPISQVIPYGIGNMQDLHRLRTRQAPMPMVCRIAWNDGKLG